MKILLLNPPVSGLNTDALQMREPLGLAYLAATLKTYDYDVSILDFYSFGKGKITKIKNKFRKGAIDQEISEKLEEFNPDIIGITCNFTIYSEDALNTAKIAKEKHPNATVILGGAHASMISPHKLLENKYIDIIVRGEGEITLLEIAQRCAAKKPFDDVKGALIKKGDRIIINSPRELIGDVDSIPLPARELLDMEYYLNNSDIFGHAKRKPIAILMTSRGCPYNCIFCSVKSLWERTWRSFSATRALREIKILVYEYGVKEIFIYDDNFIIDKKRVIQICNLIIENKLNITLAVPSGLSVDLIDHELLKILKRAGLYRVVLPIETGYAKTMHFIGKPINLEEVKEKIEMCHKLGLWTSGNFLIGFPYETKEDIYKTIKFAENSTLDFVFYFVAQPYAGSDLYEIFKKEGLLPDNGLDITSSIMQTRYNSKFLTARQLQDIRDEATARYPKLKIKQYISHPRLFITKVMTLSSFIYFIKLLINKEFILRILGVKKI